MNNKNLNEITNCHSGLDPESRNEMLNQVQHDSREGCEQGRSMVEMLGVLAVMGLLTIIGIAGFKIAMNKAKANNLVADMNQLAHIVVMDKFSGYSEEAIQNAVNEHNQSTEYQAEYEYRTPQVFALKTKNVIDKTLCQQVANLAWQLPIATYLNKVKVEGSFNAENCTDENELIWAFTNDLSACPDCPLGDFDCTPYANRECGSCDSIGYTPKNEDCTNNANGQYCVNGKCRACDTNQFWDTSSNSCQACIDDGTNTNWYTTSEYIHACLGSMYVGYLAGSPLLQACTKPSYAINNTEEESCKACPNRCYLNGTCYLAGENRIYSRKSREDGTCQCNYSENGTCKCPPNHFWHNASNSYICKECFDDSTNTAWISTSEYRHACPGTMMLNSFFPGMIGCSRPVDAQPDVDEIDCTACPNRCYNPADQKCYFFGSGKTYTGKDAEGRCTTE